MNWKKLKNNCLILSSGMAENRGKLVILSAPSGAGKTTLVKHLLQAIPDFVFSISATSRKRRPGEQHGKDYYFLSATGFREKIREGAFLEWEEVYEDHFYGTLRSEVDEILASGRNVVLDVDVMGGKNIKEEYGTQALAVFVKPPRFEDLEMRLRGRSTESEESLRKRMEKAELEWPQAEDFDVILINDSLPEAKQDIERIVRSFLEGEEGMPVK
jgi:guanylate kinase